MPKNYVKLDSSFENKSIIITQLWRQHKKKLYTLYNLVIIWLNDIYSSSNNMAAIRIACKYGFILLPQNCVSRKTSSRRSDEKALVRSPWQPETEMQLKKI